MPRLIVISRTYWPARRDWESIESLPPVGTVFDMPVTAFKLGCALAVDIRISTDVGVSRNHAHFEQRDGTWWVRDYASTWGTWVRGKNSTEWTELHDGERITIGPVADPDIASSPGLTADDQQVGIVLEFREP